MISPEIVSVFAGSIAKEAARVDVMNIKILVAFRLCGSTSYAAGISLADKYGFLVPTRTPKRSIYAIPVHFRKRFSQLKSFIAIPEFTQRIFHFLCNMGWARLTNETRAVLLFTYLAFRRLKKFSDALSVPFVDAAFLSGFGLLTNHLIYQIWISRAPILESNFEYFKRLLSFISSKEFRSSLLDFREMFRFPMKGIEDSSAGPIAKNSLVEMNNLFIFIFNEFFSALGTWFLVFRHAVYRAKTIVDPIPLYTFHSGVLYATCFAEHE